MKRLLLALLLLPSLVYAQSAAQRLSQLGHVLNAGSPAASSSAGTIPMLQSGTVVVLSWPALINGDCLTNNGSTLSWMACSSGGMVYPGAGIPNSTGTAWGTSYSATNPIPANYVTVQTFTGDCTNSGTLTFTCSKVNGAAFPTSAVVVGSNASAQPVAATTTGTGSVVLASAPTIANLTVTGTCTGCGSGSSVTLQTNGTNNTSQTTLNLQNGQGVVITNPSGGNATIATTVPQRTVTTSPTIASTDMGGVIIMNVTGGGTLTVPAISSTVLASGMSVGIVNYSASTAAVSTTPTINSGGGCVSGTGIPSGDTWQLISNGTSLDCIQTVSASSGGTQQSPLGFSNGNSISQASSTFGTSTGVFSAFAGTLKNLYVRTNAAPASGQTFTFTVYVAPAATPGSLSATSITCQITSSSANNECSDTTDSASIAAGGIWNIQVVTSATSGSTGGQAYGLEVDH